VFQIGQLRSRAAFRRSLAPAFCTNQDKRPDILARRAGRRPGIHRLAASHSHEPPDADTCCGTPPRKRDTENWIGHLKPSFLGRMPHWLRHAALPSGEDGRGEGKLNCRSGEGQRARSDRPTGGGYSASGTRGQSPWRSRTIKATEAISLPQPQRGSGNGTLARRAPTGDVTASRAKTRMLRHRRSAAGRSECVAGARTARREARAPAGQRLDQTRYISSDSR
jgi:hypothetical protein